MRFSQRLLVTACAATGTTEAAASRLGATPFLPALFAQRYANMGALDRQRFEAQIRACRSLDDDRWCTYWNEIALGHLRHAASALSELGDPAGEVLKELPGEGRIAGLELLGETIAPYARLLADHSLVPPADAIEQFVAAHSDRTLARRAPSVLSAVLELLRAITYLQVSAFPGGTPHRMQAYRRSRALFDALAAGFTTGLDTIVEQVSISAGTETVEAYRCLPAKSGRSPVVIVTNGLEGTVQELLVPLLRYHASGLGVLVMEMPGSYAYEQPMSGASEMIYRRVIDTVMGDPRVDAERVGIVGVSFGGYWAARMAAADPRLACAVACGAPTDRSFRPTLGLPEIIIDALSDVTGATTPLGLLRRLRRLSLRGRYRDIGQPILVINGDNDTLLSTRDSVELAARAPRGELRLYPDDDHCAMGHYREWLDASQHWLADQLLGDPQTAATSTGPEQHEARTERVPPGGIEPPLPA